YILTFIASMFSTMTNAFRPMSVVGMTDYIKNETGAQMNGLISAIGGFAYKCGTAISSAILAGILAVTGYIPGAIGQEPEAVLMGINSARFLVPVVATVLYIIFIQFYPEKKMMEHAQNK
ncbi:MFS transporter, partial [Lachnospiraceae bacterium OttesenSCG-928-D06]|nr:MFS transporter [Lachnospiraceae bacterium OttesenSCG-928-D06]